jgi:hypothetical protein
MKIEGLKNIGAFAVIVAIASAVLVLGIQLLTTNITAQRQQQVTTDTVIHRIEKQFFVVTRSIYSDEESKIKITRDSDWNEFLWGKEIVAAARVRSDLGVNFKDLKAENIKIDTANKIIRITNTKAEILDSSIFGKLKVSTQGSLLTQLFDKDTNEDYKMASEKLIESANKAVVSDQELLSDAKQGTEQFLAFLFADLGYTVKIE